MRRFNSAGLAGQEATDASAALEMDLQGIRLLGELVVPPDALALVVFAHGSGSSRLSGRSQRLAQALQHSGLATFLFDLLTPNEAQSRRNALDIALLSHRLGSAAHWIKPRPEAAGLPLCFFGASTGAAAALVAATDQRLAVQAVVSCGGRPDLAFSNLLLVKAPSLLIVGALDLDVLRLNRWALHQLACEKRLAVVPGASHLFEEAGTLEQVAALAGGWFLSHLAAPPGQ